MVGGGGGGGGGGTIAELNYCLHFEVFPLYAILPLTMPTSFILLKALQ